MNFTIPRFTLVAEQVAPLLVLSLLHSACAEEEFQMPASTAAEVEQTTAGTQPSATLVASFDGLGFGFRGPHGPAAGRNPSDNSLAVGPDHIVQTVNSRLAIFSKTGDVLYGAVPTNTVFRGFGGTCETRNNGDAVVRYDQLADRWLIVMPIFRRMPARPDQPETWEASETAYLSPPGVPGQPGPAAPLFIPPLAPADSVEPARSGRRLPRPPEEEGPYSMCYAVSTSSDPIGSYYRYEFLRPLFPDYPRPAVWPDGYYNPTSTGDDVVQKHTCVVDRNRMLAGEPATEQCFVVDDVNFLNNADLDGKALPPAGAPNVVMATGGTQLEEDFADDGIYAWQFAVDWENPEDTRLSGPEKIAVAPYEYLCDGQLTNCRPAAGFTGRQDHGPPGVPEPERPGIHRRCSLGGHGSGRWRGALVRVPSEPGPHSTTAATGYIRSRRFLSLDGQPRHRP